MNGRPIIAAPPAPVVDVPLPAPALHLGAARVDWRDSWGALTGWALALLAGGALTGYGWAAASWPVVGIGAAAVALAAFRFTLTGMQARSDWRHEQERRAQEAEFRAVQIAAYADAYAAQVAASAAHSARYGKAPRDDADPPPVVNPAAALERALAPLSARLDALTAQLSELQTAPQETRARVEPPADDQATRQLADDRAARDRLAGAYWNGPAHVLLSAAWAGKPITHEAMAEGSAPYMTSPQWKALTGILGDAGVLTKTGQTRPWHLAAAYRAATESAAHAAVIDRLVACPDLPALPSDMTG